MQMKVVVAGMLHCGYLAHNAVYDVDDIGWIAGTGLQYAVKLPRMDGASLLQQVFAIQASGYQAGVC
ncbi:MAG: hypothetical protein ACLRW4_02890 [Ruminococcus sp.]